MTSTLLRSIVGSVLIDLVCLLRRRKLCHFHKLLSLLILSLLVICTIGGMRLDLPYSFFVFSWTVGLATEVVIASCHAGAYMSELMHRKAFQSVSTISAKLKRIEEENKSQRATGKNILEQLVELLKQMGTSLSTIDPGILERPARETIVHVSALQAKCLGVLTSGRDMYAVNWLSPEVPPEMQVLYKKFIEPYVRQDSALVGPHDVQTLNAAFSHQGRLHKQGSLPCVVRTESATLGHPESAKGEPLAGPAPFLPMTIFLDEGVHMPEVESACLMPDVGLCEANDPVGKVLLKAWLNAPENQNTQTIRGQAPVQPSTIMGHNATNTQEAANFQKTEANQNKRFCAESLEPPNKRSRSRPIERDEGDAKSTQGSHWGAAAVTSRGLPLWGGLSAESDVAIEESLKSPSVGGAILNIGTEWNIDMFALDQATEENVRQKLFSFRQRFGNLSQNFCPPMQDSCAPPLAPRNLIQL